MNKHTPGPWHHVHFQNGLLLILGPNDETVINSRKTKGDNLDNDASLIAAAPDLLECLIDARAFIATTLAMVGDGHRISELVQDFDTAIKKATIP